MDDQIEDTQVDDVCLEEGHDLDENGECVVCGFGGDSN